MGRRVAATAAVIIAAVGGCGGGDATGPAATAGPAVVAGFYPIFEAATRVAGERGSVSNLTRAGSEPHDLEPTSRQVDQILDADLVFYLGGGFQPALEKVAERRGELAVDLLEGVDLIEGDPHVWLDPRVMAGIVTRVEAALVGADPGGAAGYKENAAVFRAELERLDRAFEAALANCERRVVITAHAAFGYLARRYDLTQEALAGFSPEAEPDPERLAELAGLVASTGTTTVFTETLAPPRLSETLAREAGVRTAVLNPLEGLTSAQQSSGASYVSVMEENLFILTEALGCTAG